MPALPFELRQHKAPCTSTAEVMKGMLLETEVGVAETAMQTCAKHI